MPLRARPTGCDPSSRDTPQQRNPTRKDTTMTRMLRVTALVLLVVAAAMPAWAQGQPAPKYSAKVPPSITTPDTVQTRIGTLKFFDGLSGVKRTSQLQRFVSAFDPKRTLNAPNEAAVEALSAPIKTPLCAATMPCPVPRGRQRNETPVTSSPFSKRYCPSSEPFVLI